MYERVFSIDRNPVEVEKIGFSSAKTSGHIVSCDFSGFQENEFLFQDAIVVKGCSGPFLEGGDSGSLVFFHDKNNQKQVFAYGVCELDELPALIPTTSVDDDSDGSSIWDEDQSCSSNKDESEEETEHEDEEETEHEDKRECRQDKECNVKSKENNEDECGGEHGYVDQNKSEDENGDNKYDNDADDQSDVEVVFQESTGPYFICLRLDTALENLGLDKAACYSDCGGK
jgi:hypothetical protein